MKANLVEHAFTLRCYAVLGVIAQKQGRHDEATEYFSYVMEYKPAVQANRSMLHKIRILKKQAAAGLLAIANNPALPAFARMDRIHDLINRYPKLQEWNAEILGQVLARLRMESDMIHQAALCSA